MIVDLSRPLARLSAIGRDPGVLADQRQHREPALAQPGDPGAPLEGAERRALRQPQVEGDMVLERPEAYRRPAGPVRRVVVGRHALAPIGPIGRGRAVPAGPQLGFASNHPVRDVSPTYGG